ncbi:hypothetical protein QVD99_007095 [Batrachochytrium dendrobatidis]|nr:hypothetical protein O5D80_007631 [Batrachochytrium dendrobatidis]KAK5666336.1 hypothetical protein QVD99_007095 [Batrachochytrium dendrobatidis]
MVAVSERDYITKGIQCGIRADGRGSFDSRPVFLETGMITQASGSCRVTIDHGTDVLAGVKVQVADVEGRVEQYTGDIVEQTGTEVADDLNTSLADGNGFSNRGNVGRIVCSVECSPAASIILDSRAIEDMCNEYTQVLNRTLNGPHGGIDLQKLCIIPGSTCWVVSVDVLIMDYGGNVLDTVLMAVRGALHNTRLPKTKVEETDGHFEFDIADDETEVLCGRENIPVALTLSRIGSGHIVDASPLEDMCSSSKITVFVNASGYICGVQKTGKGSLEPSTLIDMIETASRLGSESLVSLDSILLSEERDRLNRVEPIGFR